MRHEDRYGRNNQHPIHDTMPYSRVGNYTSLLCDDNVAMIQNSTISTILSKKRHMAITYHKTREATAAGIVHPIKIHGKENYSDVMTKG